MEKQTYDEKSNILSQIKLWLSGDSPTVLLDSQYQLLVY
jgi:hypothetical protein